MIYQFKLIKEDVNKLGIPQNGKFEFHKMPRIVSTADLDN